MKWKTITAVVLYASVVIIIGALAIKFPPRAEAAGSIISSFPVNTENPVLIAGITKRGDNYWITDGFCSFVYEITPTGGVASSFEAPVKSGNLRYANLHGIAYVNEGPTGEYLYLCSSYDHILKTTLTGSLVSSFSLNQRMGGGLCYDGANLYMLDYQYKKLFKYSLGGSVISSFNAPDYADNSGRFPFGLAYDGQYLWVASYGNNDMIYKVTTTGSIVGAGIAAPNTPNPHVTAIAADGDYLIYGDDAVDTLYRIDK